jgi:hypothetical protein
VIYGNRETEGRSFPRHAGHDGAQNTDSGHLHGYAIAQLIQQLSDNLLWVEEGSLYPALGIGALLIAVAASRIDPTVALRAS